MPILNPFVGPNVFCRNKSYKNQRKWFFGREQEALGLLSLVLSERLVLFHAPSGAGKSSLINARLVPCLTWRNVHVLPIGRVRTARPASGETIDNVFVYNLLSSLDNSIGAEAAPKGNTTISKYLHSYLQAIRTRPRWTDSRAVLIIDQFEEIFATDEENWWQREGFFDQLRQAMRPTPGYDPMLWVVLAMRDDYVARLAPFAYLLPGKLSTRFYMQPLKADSAREAIAEPASLGGREFEELALDRLVTDLLRVRQGNTDKQGYVGEFVQPLQLQVVCSQLWEKLKDEPPGPITEEQVRTLANVDGALTDFYEQALQEVLPLATKAGISESDLRLWFRNKLITEEHDRTVVLRQATETGGLPNPLIDLLAQKRLIQPTSTASGRGTYYELIHDRFIDAILEANAKWRDKNPLIGLAESWESMGRPRDALLRGEQLEKALQDGYKELGEVVAGFIAASQKEKQRQDVEKERRRKELQTARQLAEAQEKRAEAEKARAEAEQQRAEEQEKRAEAEQQRAEEQERYARRNLGFAIFAGIVCVFLVVFMALAALRTFNEQLTLARLWAASARLEMERDPIVGLLLAWQAHDLSGELSQDPYRQRVALVKHPHPELFVVRALDLLDRTRDYRTEASSQSKESVDVLRQVLANVEAGISIESAEGDKAHLEDVTAIELNPSDGSSIYTAGRDGRVVKWTWNDDQPERPLVESGEVFGDSDSQPVIAVSPDGTWAVTRETNEDNENRLELHRTQKQADTVEPLDLDNVGESPFAAFDATGRWLAWGGQRQWQMWDLSTPEKVTPSTVISNVEAVTFGDEPATAVIAHEGMISMVDLAAEPGSARQLQQKKEGWTSANSVVLSDDERWLLVGPQSGPAWLYDLADAKATIDELSDGITLPGYDEEGVEEVRSADFHPLDSDWLAIGTGADDVYLLHFGPNSRWTPVLQLKTRHRSVDVLRFSADGRWLLSGGSDGNVRAWRLDLAQGVSHGVNPVILAIPEDGASAVCFEEDARVIAAGPENVRFAWSIADLQFPDLPSCREATLPETGCANRWFDVRDVSLMDVDMARAGNPTAEALSGDGKWAVFRDKQGEEQCVVFLDKGSDGSYSFDACLPYGGGDITALAHYAGEQDRDERLAVGDKDGGKDEEGRVWLWKPFSLDTGTSLSWNDPISITLDAPPRCFAFSPDGTRLAVVGTNPSHLDLIDSDTGGITQIDSESRSAEDSALCQDMTFSPDGKYLSVATSGGGVWLWSDLDTAEPSRSSLFDGKVDDLAFSPSGEHGLWLAGVTQDTDEVRLWRILSTDLEKLACQAVRHNMTLWEYQDILEGSEDEASEDVCRTWSAADCDSD